MGFLDNINLTKLFSDIISGLRKSPIILFAFAVIFIVFIFAIAIIEIEKINPSLRMYSLALGCALMAGILILAMVLILKFASSTAKSQSPQKPDNEFGELVVAAELRQPINVLSNNYAVAKKVMPARVLQEIDFEINHLVEKSKNWADGAIDPPAERYEKMLKEAYKGAALTIFATCIKEYLSTWESQLGEELLEIHKGGRATVQRAFLIESEGDITKRLLDIIKKHNATKNVEALVLVATKTRLEYPITLTKDFTIIDGGKMLAVTHTYGIANLRARWKFTENPGENKTIQEIVDFQKDLISKCMTADEFIEKYQSVA